MAARDSNTRMTVFSLLEPPRLPDCSVIREEVRSIPGRFSKAAGRRLKSGIRVRIVLDRRDADGRIIGQHVLSKELTERDFTKVELYRARCLYPAARIELVED